MTSDIILNSDGCYFPIHHSLAAMYAAKEATILSELILFLVTKTLRKALFKASGR